MPVIFVFGIPEETLNLRSLRNDLKKSVASIHELFLTEKDTTVFFPRDLVGSNLEEEEIIIKVEGLTVKVNRTPEVRNKLAEAIQQTVLEFFQDPKPKLIEVFIIPFNHDNGFKAWSYK